MNPATQTTPCEFSAQLAHLVLVPRTVKTMHVHTYTTTQAVVQVDGYYKGIDSSDSKDVGNLNKESVIHNTNLLMSVHCRADMKALLQKMVKDGKISAEHATACIQAAANMVEHIPRGVRADIQAVYIPVAEALEGATSISFIDSIILERNLTEALSCKDLHRKSYNYVSFLSRKMHVLELRQTKF